MNKHKKIPKIIWFLWFQGWDRSPLIVKKCFESWKKHNPDWKIVFLCDDNLTQYISLDVSPQKLVKLDRTHLSDLVRLKLLSQYGGIWVDSTCFCIKPLDIWFDVSLYSGFFAFSNPGKDRLLSNWFLASQPNHPIVDRLYKKLVLYWQNNNFRSFKKDLLMKLLIKLLNRNTKVTKYWFSRFVCKVLKIYPYYCFHYLFTELVSNDYECKMLWHQTPNINADIPHKILKVMHDTLSKEIKYDIDSKVDFLYKLNWKKYQSQLIKTESTIYYLLSST